MASYTTEDFTRRIRRWIVPAPNPDGACIGDINAAAAMACRAYREAHGIAEGGRMPDDALRFHPRDDAIVIEFWVETTA
ncbi:hypothetical protein SAMN06272781_6852 [Streptomyces sp. 1222.2]|uniref:hypothetical protein n=1 Tax=Streptomyces sp. 1222.2 TaxID=1938833 RepID=UPI000BC7DA67|nr:hypothetical protein [Streptomyces sp. 1222.2]SOD80069.1 hypothetical protein SAMN06272781_6852 [Streptomyces sp. 1222.2]